MNAENRWLVLACKPKLFGGCNTSKLLQNSGTRLPQLTNTSSFHQNVGEGNKSFNAMYPDPLLSEAFGKGSGCARLVEHWTLRVDGAPTCLTHITIR